MQLNALSIAALRPSTLWAHSRNIVVLHGQNPLSSMSTAKHRLPSKNEQKRKKPKTTASPSPSSNTNSSSSNEWFHTYVQSDPLYHEYMTTEWGNEQFYQTDNQLFEKLSLEGAQSGLSWRTILHKRQAYRDAFHMFDIDTVASMTSGDVDSMLSQQSDDPKELVVRHRGKIESVIHNAKIIQALKSDGVIHTFKEYLWSFVDNKPILNSWKSFHDIPSKTVESEALSKDLKKKGFKFVGPTTVYAFMQSCGFVIDHPVGTSGWIEAEGRLKSRDGGYQRR